MKESLPPVHIGPILEGESTPEFDLLREKAREEGVYTIVASRGGGALLQRTLGCLPVLHREGIIGCEPWGMVGTSTGAISTFFAREIGFADPEAWHRSLEPIAQFDGWKRPWGELTTNGIKDRALRKLEFQRYYEQQILPHIPDPLPDAIALQQYAKPALTGVVVTGQTDRQPYIYHDAHWIDTEGNFSYAQMIRCVEGSCSLPIFASKQDPHIGAVIDGGMNEYNLHSPIQIARHILPDGGRIISIEPASNLKRGVHVVQEDTIQIIRIVMEHQSNRIQQARNIFVYNRDAYQVGAHWGEYAAEVIHTLDG